MTQLNLDSILMNFLRSHPRVLDCLAARSRDGLAFDYEQFPTVLKETEKIECVAFDLIEEGSCEEKRSGAEEEELDELESLGSVERREEEANIVSEEKEESIASNTR